MLGTNSRTFAERIRDAACASMTIADLAARIGKRPSTLARELNGFDHGAKLGLADAASIVRATGNPELLHIFAAACGYEISCVPCSASPAESPRTPAA